MGECLPRIRGLKYLSLRENELGPIGCKVQWMVTAVVLSIDKNPYGFVRITVIYIKTFIGFTGRSRTESVVDIS
jgi:hypothetical protein